MEERDYLRFATVASAHRYAVLGAEQGFSSAPLPAIYKKTPLKNLAGLFHKWRRERDSNPRNYR